MLPHTIGFRAPRRASMLLLGTAVSAALLLSPLAARPAFAAETSALPRLSAPATVASGSTASLVVAVGGGAVRTVRLQSRVHGTVGWHPVRALHPDRTGRARVVSPALLRSTDFRVVTSAAGRTTTGAAVTIAVPTAVRVTGHSDLTPTTDDRITLTGTSTSGLAGRRIDLERLAGATWRRVATTTIGADARFSIGARPTAAGEQRYRVRVPATDGRPEAVSDAVPFVVSAWYSLADVAAVPATDPTVQSMVPGERVLNGVPYAQTVGLTIRAGSDAIADYDLRSSCTAFRATLGSAADSDPDFTGRGTVVADDAVVADARIDPSASAAVAEALDAPDRLRLRSFTLRGNGGADWGDPQVLCDGRP